MHRGKFQAVVGADGGIILAIFPWKDTGTTHDAMEREHYQNGPFVHEHNYNSVG